MKNNLPNARRIATFFAILICIPVFASISTATAQEVRITEDIMSVEYIFAGKTHKIQRNQNTEARLPDAFAKTSRTCPVFCVQPMKLHEDVETYGELEVLAFLEDYVSTGKGFLIDSRTTDFYQNGTIPGAVNLPFNVFIPSDNNVFFGSLMNMLGGKLDQSGEWEFVEPKDLLLFCNGPWCEQSPAAIRNLLAINYPADKLYYYRGGMQNWVGMGFTVELPSSGS